ncbi:alpha/beta-hydrolase [Aspergillus sergii]|uniref:Alpha/beta-hydrolase n=1 Tax=Aspergillus sergii TaxID=1034303 RepID=A0A5N6XPC6_9EURO|nr:alpha/beta-hydrolase [Aspergillus sergii]
MKRSALLIIACSLGLASGSVTVRKTDQPPTGYEVTFEYINNEASNIKMGGDFYSFTDQYHTTPQFNAGLDLHNYKPGDFLAPISGTNYGPGGKQVGYEMTKNKNGVWTYTTPFPSGTFQYWFLPDCDYAPNCTSIGQFVTDPENPPIENYPGQQNASIFQVPYDARFQAYGPLGLDFDYALPVHQVSERGVVSFVNYTSAGSTIPAPNIHDYAIYLPAGYNSSRSETQSYPLLYLNHGATGNCADWPNTERMSNIFDQLIAEGELEPTVVVMPSYNGLGADINRNTTAIRDNFMRYLFPHIQSTYAVSSEPDRRAFAGLSLGSALTYEMYINATSYFGYFGLFSGALQATPALGYINNSMVAKNADLANRGLFISFGAFDVAFDDCRNMQNALDSLGIHYVTRLVPYRAHYKNTWQDSLWHFLRIVLWKGRPVTLQSGHGVQ